MADAQSIVDAYNVEAFVRQAESPLDCRKRDDQNTIRCAYDVPAATRGREREEEGERKRERKSESERQRQRQRQRLCAHLYAYGCMHSAPVLATARTAFTGQRLTPHIPMFSAFTTRNELQQVDCLELHDLDLALYVEHATIAVTLAGLFLRIFTYLDPIFGIGAPEPAQRKNCCRVTFCIFFGISLVTLCGYLILRQQGLQDVPLQDFIGDLIDGVQSNNNKISRTKKNAVQRRTDTLYTCYSVAILVVGSAMVSYLQAYRGEVAGLFSTLCVEFPCFGQKATDRWYVGRKSPLATKNLLEVTDGLRRPP